MRVFLAVIAAFVVSVVRAEIAPRPVVVLISMDGFRWDYCDLYPESTPNLQALRQQGAFARGLIPVFPSVTFPNHYSIVTGLYPTHHGIVSNTMFDPQLGEFFYYNRSASVQESKWWGGEPIWVTAILQGRTSACSFWPGNEAPIKGVSPTWWKRYDYSIPFQQRLDELMGWLNLPDEKRPALITFYLEETNSVGHKFGPRSPQIRDAIKVLDDRVGQIAARVTEAHLDDVVNFVVVSDHGMTSVSQDKVVVLEDHVDGATVQVDFEGPVAGLRPLQGTPAELVTKLNSSFPPQVRAHLLDDLPERFHYRDNPRIPPVIILPDLGWQAERRATFAKYHASFNVGEHGYDPASTDMAGILIAKGPAFRTGVIVEPVENIHVYNLLCAVLGFKPAPNDGDDRLVKSMLRLPGEPAQMESPKK